MWKCSWDVVLEVFGWGNSSDQVDSVFTSKHIGVVCLFVSVICELFCNIVLVKIVFVAGRQSSRFMLIMCLTHDFWFFCRYPAQVISIFQSYQNIEVSINFVLNRSIIEYNNLCHSALPIWFFKDMLISKNSGFTRIKVNPPLFLFSTFWAESKIFLGWAVTQPASCPRWSSREIIRSGFSLMDRKRQKQGKEDRIVSHLTRPEAGGGNVSACHLATVSCGCASANKSGETNGGATYIYVAT